MSPAPRRTQETPAPEHEAEELGKVPVDEAASEKAPAPESSVKLPDTKPYRVSIGGAMYTEPKITMGFDGKESVIYVSKLGERGEEINLTPREAHRLTELGAVLPKDEPLGYDEMNDKQLDAAVKDAGVKVISSGADQDRPLRADKINALRTFDQGRGVAQP